MGTIDRAALIVLLDRLGSPDHDTVMTSARELHRMVMEGGEGWDELLRPGATWPGGPARDDDEAADSAPGELTDVDTADASRLIASLLERGEISETLREDLRDLKQALADGSFEPMDLRYVRALARRLGA